MRLLQKAENSNTIFGNSFLIFLIRFFPSLATVLVAIVFSRNLSEADYGMYQNFWVHLFLLSAVASLGIPAFLLTYTPSRIKQLLSLLKTKHYISIFVWMTIWALVYALLRGEVTGAGRVVPTLFFLLYGCNAISESLLIVLRKFRLLLLVNGLYTVVFLWLHFGVLNGDYSIYVLFQYLLTPLFLKLVITSWTAIRNMERIAEGEQNEYSLADIRSLWMHVGIYDVLQKLFTWIDKFVISLVFSAGVFAMYFNGTFDIPFLPLLLGAVSSAALLQMSSFSKKGDIDSTVQIANQTARMLSAVVFPLFFFLFMFREELFTVLLTNKYHDAVPIFAATVFVVPLRAYNFTSILQNRHKGRIINIGAVLDIIIACVLMYPLYQLFGLVGIAVSFVISSYIQGAYYLYHTGNVLETAIHRLIPIRNWLGKLLVFGLLFIGTHYLLSMSFSQSIVLFLGSVVLTVTLLVAVLIEFRASKKAYGESVSQI